MSDVDETMTRLANDLRAKLETQIGKTNWEVEYLKSPFRDDPPRIKVYWFENMDKLYTSSGTRGGGMAFAIKNPSFGEEAIGAILKLFLRKLPQYVTE